MLQHGGREFASQIDRETMINILESKTLPRAGDHIIFKLLQMGAIHKFSKSMSAQLYASRREVLCANEAESY